VERPSNGQYGEFCPSPSAKLDPGHLVKYFPCRVRELDQEAATVETEPERKRNGEDRSRTRLPRRGETDTESW